MRILSRLRRKPYATARYSSARIQSATLRREPMGNSPMGVPLAAMAILTVLVALGFILFG